MQYTTRAEKKKKKTQKSEKNTMQLIYKTTAVITHCQLPGNNNRVKMGLRDFRMDEIIFEFFSFYEPVEKTLCQCFSQ